MISMNMSIESVVLAVLAIVVSQQVSITVAMKESQSIPPSHFFHIHIYLRPPPPLSPPASPFPFRCIQCPFNPQNQIPTLSLFRNPFQMVSVSVSLLTYRDLT